MRYVVHPRLREHALRFLGNEAIPIPEILSQGHDGRVRASVLLAAGTAMVMLLSHWDRRLELGTLVARGCHGGDLLRLILADSLVSILQALLFGIPLGFAGAAILVFWALPSHPTVLRVFVVSAQSWAPFLSLLASVVLLSAVVAIPVARRMTRESLRARVIA